MAVSFKVPKSPQRDIFTIDSFQGVDFTNTPTSIDPTKSPNAENMVRLVPGKVRKRTGYKSKIIFSDGTDVNRVKNSTEYYVDVDLSQMGDTLETGISFAQFYDIIPAGGLNIRFEVAGKGHFRFAPNPTNGTTWNFDHDDDYEAYYWKWGNNTEGVQDLRVYRVGEIQDGDYLRIRKVILNTKASVPPVQMVWTPAPEDNGGKYVNRLTIDPIYGCHILKTYDANRVVNVNRFLNSSDTFETYSVDDTDKLEIGTLGDILYSNYDGSVAMTMRVEFDYICDNRTTLFIGNWYYSSSNFLEDTEGNTVHYSVAFRSGSYSPQMKVYLKTVSGSSTVQIKNLSIMYQKDDNYTWTPAPEDNGETFHIEDVYETLPNNFAINESYYYTGDSSSLVATAIIPIGDASSNIIGCGHISFDLETSAGDEIDKIYVRIYNSANVPTLLVEEEFTDNIQQHFDYYTGSFYTDRYFANIQVEFHLTNEDATCLALLNNIKVRQIQPRGSYKIFSKDYVYHVGKDFYLYSSADEKIEKIYSGANPSRSVAWQLNDQMIVLDGETPYIYKLGEGIKKLTDGDGYIPLLTISKEPGQVSSGTPYESLNLIQPAFKEEFTVPQAKASEPRFQLSLNNLDSNKPPIVEVLTGGTWVRKTLNTDYVWNAQDGYVYFYNLPGTSVPAGADTVRITAYKTIDGYSDRISKCTIGTLFGVGGAADRLFLSGNPDHPNWDFYSGQFDPTYFPDTGYSVLGSAASSIVGYAIVNNYLATFKDEYDQAQNVTIREGDLVVNNATGTSEPAFKIINTLQGGGVVAPYSFGYLQTEPLFLTRSGIYAITPQDITGEKYSQNRSFYLNGKLTKEQDLEYAQAVIFDDQYILALNQKLYILDGLQPMRTDKSMPYATRQYAGFYCTNIPSSYIWTDDQALWIGTYNGRVCRFDTDIEALESYNDDGDAIECCWETPDLDGQLFYKNKTFRYFAVRIMNALRTSISIWAEKRGSWGDAPIKEDEAAGSMFDFENIDFEHFTFNTDSSAKVVYTKVRVKKVDKARFRVENKKKNEPFGLYDLALEYIESGNYKG